MLVQTHLILTETLAHDAVVFLVTAMNSNWKLPIGYFLANGLSGRECANLITIALQKLPDVGVMVASTTCDRPSGHFAMTSSFRAKLSVCDMVPYFSHLCDDPLQVYALLDCVHMLKLVRNTFARLGVLFNKEGGRIEW